MKKQYIEIDSISVVGGVSNNKYISKKINDFANSKKLKVFFPIKEMMSDNAAMIAWNCIVKDKKLENIFFKPLPRLII